MSRRYGRKQRRLAQQQILGLAKGLATSVQEGMKIRRQRDALMESIQLWDEEIRGLLGSYTSFAIDDTTFRVDHPDLIRQLPVIPPLSPEMLSASTMPEHLTYYVETMLGFIAGLENDDLMRMRRLMTVRVQVGTDRAAGQAYYALSEQMWSDLKKAGPDAWRRMTYRIASDLVRLLAAPPKKMPSGDDLFPLPRFEHATRR